MDIARDYIYLVVCLKHRFSGLERKGAGTVSNVHGYTGISRPLGGLDNPTTFIYEAHGMSGRTVSQDIPRAHELEHVLDLGRAIADVNHEGQVAPIGGSTSSPERFEAVLPHGPPVDARFHAPHQLRVPARKPYAEVNVAVSEVREFICLGDQTDRRDIQQGKDAHGGWLNDKLVKAGQGKSTGRSYVKPGADPGTPCDRVGVDAPEGDPTVDVRMQVNQTRGNVLSGCVDDLQCSLSRDRPVHRGDTTRPNCDIKSAVIVTGRIDHLSVLD